MKVLDYIAHETERQSGTIREALGMYEAFENMSKRLGPLLEVNVLYWASLINGQQGYRMVPVYFRSGGHAADHHSVPRLMKSWLNALNDRQTTLTFNGDYKAKADYFAKEFLDIHPFVDGNGRVASLIWNWIQGNNGDRNHMPEPLPYFYGEQ